MVHDYTKAFLEYVVHSEGQDWVHQFAKIVRPVPVEDAPEDAPPPKKPGASRRRREEIRRKAGAEEEKIIRRKAGGAVSPLPLAVRVCMLMCGVTSVKGKQTSKADVRTITPAQSSSACWTRSSSSSTSPT